jgi:DNA helicase-2/ATP-dependent DNA helicase PcrA
MKELLQNNSSLGYVVDNILQLYENFRFIRTLQPFAAVNYIRKGVGYDDYLKKQAREGGRDCTKDFDELDELLELSKGFETLGEWLEHIEDYDSIMEKQAKERAADEDAVNIVTMHGAKGLEWKVVILPDVNEGVVPHNKAVTKEEIEEERRMFYVAMTRAKENLFIFYIDNGNGDKKTNKNGTPKVGMPSRFIDEIL